MKVTLFWTDPNFGEVEQRVYRDSAPIDPDNLPAPLATLSPGVLSWTDENATQGLTYYYAVSALVQGEEVVSDSLEVLVEPTWPAAPHWRVNITETHAASGFRFWIAEMQLRETPGGPSVATGGTPSASVQYAGNEAQYAFDGNPSTGWSSTNNAAPPQWLRYSLPSARTIAEVALQAGDTTARAGRAPAALQIQYSTDGVNWTTAKTYTGIPAWAAGEVRTFSTL